MNARRMKTRYEVRVDVFYDLDGNEYHQLYMWATERPGNRIVLRNPAARVRPPIRQPARDGFNRRGRRAVS